MNNARETTSSERRQGARITPTRRGPWLQIASLSGFEWNRVEFPIPGLPRELHGLRIVHISDLHFQRRWLAAYDEMIGRVAENPPELVVITGDFVDDKYDPRPAMPIVERFVTQLKSQHGIYSILGNHDAHFMVPHLARWGVEVVGYRPVKVDVSSERRDFGEISRAAMSDAGNSDGATKRRSDEGAREKHTSLIPHRSAVPASAIELIGLEGVVRQDLNVDQIKQIAPKADDTLRIVLSHYPDALRRIGGLGADLFLTGHTHGGQVCLPGRIPIIKHDSLPRPYCTGIHRVDDTWLVVNRGIGFTTLPIRVFCPSEVIEITVLKD